VAKHPVEWVAKHPITIIIYLSQPDTFQQEGAFQLNKNDLIAAVANSTGLSKSDSASAVDSVFDAIAGALKGGDEVRLVGFGTFSVTKRAATTGRNPRTGESIQIPASNQPKFKAGKGLKDAVN
jgi:DNA-binding protein HU-beta|tara:strand:- start:6 stop:377 length:372 start_codon:yes stop_codon:yes gene_type:complete